MRVESGVSAYQWLTNNLSMMDDLRVEKNLGIVH